MISTRSPPEVRATTFSGFLFTILQEVFSSLPLRVPSSDFFEKFSLEFTIRTHKISARLPLRILMNLLSVFFFWNSSTNSRVCSFAFFEEFFRKFLEEYVNLQGTSKSHPLLLPNMNSDILNKKQLPVLTDLYPRTNYVSLQTQATHIVLDLRFFF